MGAARTVVLSHIIYKEDTMPEVETASGVKRFSYTRKGKKKAKAYAAKYGKKHGISNLKMKE